MELQAPIMYIHIDTKNTHKTNFSHKTKKMLSHIIPHLQQFPKKKKKHFTNLHIYTKSHIPTRMKIIFHV